MTPQGAALLLRQLVEAKILDEARTGQAVARALMSVLVD